MFDYLVQELHKATVIWQGNTSHRYCDLILLALIRLNAVPGQSGKIQICTPALDFSKPNLGLRQQVLPFWHLPLNKISPAVSLARYLTLFLVCPLLTWDLYQACAGAHTRHRHLQHTRPPHSHTQCVIPVRCHKKCSPGAPQGANQLQQSTVLMGLTLLVLFLETQCTQLSKPTQSQLRCLQQITPSRCSSRAHPTGSCFMLRTSGYHECQNRPMARNSHGAAAHNACAKMQHLCQGEGQGGARKHCGGARAAHISWSHCGWYPCTHHTPHCSHHSLQEELETVLQITKRLPRPSSENSLQ